MGSAPQSRQGFLEDLLSRPRDFLDALRNYPHGGIGQLPQAERDYWWTKIQQGVTQGEAERELAKRYDPLLNQYKGLILPAEPGKEERAQEKALTEIIEMRKWHFDELRGLFEDYNRLAQLEYQGINELVRREIDAAAKGRNQSSLDYYKQLRPYYYKAGFTIPLSIPLTLNGIRSITFLGKPVLVHVEFERILRDAESKLAAMGPEATADVRKAITSVLGFQPRPIAGKDSLSKHALGLAIDIDAGSNPQLAGKIAAAVDDILDWVEQQKTNDPNARAAWHVSTRLLDRVLSETSHEALLQAYSRLKTISDTVQDFLTNYLANWENATEDERNELLQQNNSPYPLLKQLIEAVGKGQKPAQVAAGLKQLRVWRKKGLVTIPLELFFALHDATALSGIEWHTQKDTMHFESPLSISKKK